MGRSWWSGRDRRVLDVTAGPGPFTVVDAVSGATNEFGFRAVQDKVQVHDLPATLLHLLGLDHEKLTYRHAPLGGFRALH
jgi:hypothetical protein